MIFGDIELTLNQMEIVFYLDQLQNNAKLNSNMNVFQACFFFINLKIQNPKIIVSEN